MSAVQAEDVREVLCVLLCLGPAHTPLHEAHYPQDVDPVPQLPEALHTLQAPFHLLDMSRLRASDSSNTGDVKVLKALLEEPLTAWVGVPSVVRVSVKADNSLV